MGIAHPHQAATLRMPVHGVARGAPTRPRGKGVNMTTPGSETPQPRDIALEMGTPEQGADLESQSAAEEPAPEHPQGS